MIGDGGGSLEQYPELGINSLIEEAFPYIKVRTMLDVLAEAIVQNRSLDQVLSRPQFQDFNREQIEGFYQETDKRLKTLHSTDAQDGYRKFWERIWDVVALDDDISKMGAEGFTDPNSPYAVSYKALTEWDSPLTRQMRKEGQQLLTKGNYKELFSLILETEIERTSHVQEILPMTQYQAGVHIAYGDSLIFLSSIAGNKEE